MKVVLFGATGMIGQGVLRECLLDPTVERVLAIGRTVTGQQHPKLLEIAHQNFLDFSPIEQRLAGYDACFFCLGISSVGMSEADYRRVTFDFALAAAQALVRQSPAMTFVFVSGAGADSSERGRVMWARVKGQTENAVLKVPFRRAYVFRPAFVQPLHGITSRTPWVRAAYLLLAPLYPLLKLIAPAYVTTTGEIGRAMIRVAEQGATTPILESRGYQAARGNDEQLTLMKLSTIEVVTC